MLERRSPRALARLPSGLLLALPLILLLAACAGAPAGAPAMPAAGEQPASEPEAPEPGERAGGDTDAVVGQDGALIVRTGRLRLEVTDIGPAVDAASRLIGGLGGYVSASEEENSTSRQVATITYRVPANAWSDALAGLRALGDRVISENTQSAEVTAEVVDLDARIANLRSAEAALQEIMTRAGSIEDVLRVQRELAGTRGQIEQLTAQRDHLRERAALGTLSVSYEAPVVALTVVQEAWDIGTEMDRAVAQLLRVGQAAASLGVWLVIVALPMLLPVALVLLVIARLRRRGRWNPGAPAGPVGPSV
jgi:hypothetical protein